jgi:hypothetical protein
VLEAVLGDRAADWWELTNHSAGSDSSNFSRFFSGDVVWEGNAHYNISCAYQNSGDVKGAIEPMQQAHACYVKCFGAEHSEAVDAQEAVERLGGV